MKGKRLNCGLSLLAAGILSVALFGGCNGGADSSSGGDSTPKSEYLLNGFNNYDDLYAVKPIGVMPSDTFKMDINKDTEFLKVGAGSLRYENVHGSYHEAFMLFENSVAAEIDARKISSVSVDVFNANERVVGVSLLMKTHDGSTMFAEQATLSAGEWTTVVIDLTGYSYAQKGFAEGVSLRFDVDSPAVFYADDLVARMGADDLPPVDINELMDDLVLPLGVTKIAEENLDEHVAFVEKVFYAQRLYGENGNSSKISQTNRAKLNECVAMVEDFGALCDARTQFVSKWVYGGAITALASTDEEYGAVWSVNIPRIKNEQSISHSAISVDGYGKVVFWLYNPMDVNLKMNVHGGWFSWNVHQTQLPAKEWTKIELNARYFEYDVKGQVFFVIYGAGQIEGEFKMTSFYGVSAEIVATPVSEMIEFLPTVAELTVTDKTAVMSAWSAYENLSSSAKLAVEGVEKLSDSIKKIDALELENVLSKIAALPEAGDITAAHKEAVMEAKGYYDILSDGAKENVPDDAVAKLTACYEALSLLPDAPDGVLLGASVASNLLSGRDTGNGGTVGTAVDSTYGSVWTLRVASGTQSDFHAKSLDVTGYETVEFYIYNPTSAEVLLVLYTNSWGEQKTFKMAAGEWTKISVPTAVYGGSFFFIINTNASDGEWRITSFVGVNATKNQE